MKYREDIDGLRAAAVLAVIGFHTFPEVIKSGFVGVDIFFVISGFLISSIIMQSVEAGTFSYSDFYSRRIKRIFPALSVILLSALIFGWFQRPDEYRTLGKHIAAGGAFVTNFVLWGESGYFDADAKTKPLLHLWSLAIEEQFYIVWPILLGLVWRRFSFLTVAVVIGISSFAFSLYTKQVDAVAAFYSPFCRFWELMVGGCLAYIVLHKPEWLPKRVNVISIIGALLIAWSVFYIKPDRFPGWRALLPTLGALFIIASNGSWVSRFLSLRALVWVGLISYPMYLWHWPVEYVLSRFSDDTFTVGVLTIGTSFLLAWLTYEFVEKPIRFGRWKAPVLGGAVAALVLAGCTANLSHGFDYRIPSDLRELSRAGELKIQTEWREGKCYLHENQLEFSDECLDGRDVFLWGDSHAAALYPGLVALKSIKHFDLSQFTNSSCPPLMGWEDPEHQECRKKNDHILKLIADVKPQTVLLHADWAHAVYDVTKLEATISGLKRAGIKNIVVVGPVPHWTRSLPTMLWDCRKLDSSYLLSDISECGVDDSIEFVDVRMRKFAGKLGVKYVSAYGALCNHGSCVTKVNNSLVTFDHAHLSPAGARYLADRAWPVSTSAQSEERLRM